jgi:fermentation-respiration switch protein FrsA (DUF1100 family)
MFRGIQICLLSLYGVLPLAMALWAGWHYRRGKGRPLVAVILIACGGFGLGLGLNSLVGKLTGARVPPGEGFRLIYLSIAALGLLKFIDIILLRAARMLIRVPSDRRHGIRATLALLTQRLLMLGIVVTWAFALLLSYHPKVDYGRSPGDLKLAYTQAAFTAGDGVKLAGWWISAEPLPATPAPRRRRGPSTPPDDAAGLLDPQMISQWGRRTVIICHGMWAGKEHVLGLAWLLAQRGFNVLAFDFRGHGASGGNYVSYGDRERQDVLAGVAWVKANHPQQAENIFGIGINTGAAALLAAAADEGDGQSIDALVLIEPFAQLASLATLDARTLLPAPLAWVVGHLSLPLAGLHAGSDSRDFSPMEYADRIWPRPVLVIHGRGMDLTPTVEEMELYRRLPQPKDEFWPADDYPDSRRRMVAQEKGTTAQLVRLTREWLGTGRVIWTDRGVQYHLLKFLREAEAKQVI